MLGAELPAILSFSGQWLRAGGLCLNLANLSCSVDKLRLSIQIVTIAGSATGSVTQLLGAELLAPLVNQRVRMFCIHLSFINCDCVRMRLVAGRKRDPNLHSLARNT